MNTAENLLPVVVDSHPIGRANGESNLEALVRAIMDAIRSGTDKLKCAAEAAPPTLDVPSLEVSRLVEFPLERSEFYDYVSGLIHHLQELQCQPDSVAEYVQAETQVLASLHTLITASRYPSPTEIRMLALRYALDAREPVQSLCHLCWKRVPEGWWINFHSMRVWLAPYARLVKVHRAVRILDFALKSPPQLNLLVEEIESYLGGIPTHLDALPDDSTRNASNGGALVTGAVQVAGPTTSESDDSAFRPAKEFLWGSIDDLGKVRRVLKRNPWIRSRKPSAQRLEIHAGDWLKYLHEAGSRGGDPLDLPAELVDAAVKDVEARKASEMAEKG